MRGENAVMPAHVDKQGGADEHKEVMLERFTTEPASQPASSQLRSRLSSRLSTEETTYVSEESLEISP